jgi:hypothetical protein
MTSSEVSKQQPAQWPPRGPARILLELDQLAAAEVVKLTLNHGVYDVRAVASLPEIQPSLAEWHPHRNVGSRRG